MSFINSSKPFNLILCSNSLPQIFLSDVYSFNTSSQSSNKLTRPTRKLTFKTLEIILKFYNPCISILID